MQQGPLLVSARCVCPPPLLSLVAYQQLPGAHSCHKCPDGSTDSKDRTECETHCLYPSRDDPVYDLTPLDIDHSLDVRYGTTRTINTVKVQVSIHIVLHAVYIVKVADIVFSACSSAAVWRPTTVLMRAIRSRGRMCAKHMYVTPSNVGVFSPILILELDCYRWTGKPEKL